MLGSFQMTPGRELSALQGVSTLCLLKGLSAGLVGSLLKTMGLKSNWAGVGLKLAGHYNFGMKASC